MESVSSSINNVERVARARPENARTLLDRRLRAARTLKINGGEYEDKGEGFVFPNKVWRPNLVKYDLERFIEDTAESLEERPMDDVDADLTQVVREEFALQPLRSLLDHARLKERPIGLSEDGYGLLLPLGNKLGIDWLTAGDLRHRSFCLELYDRALEEFDVNEDDEKKLSMLLGDFNRAPPYTIFCGADGSNTHREPYHPDVLAEALAINEFYIYMELDLAKEEQCQPRPNRTKSIGPFGDDERMQKIPPQALAGVRKAYLVFGNAQDMDEDWRQSVRLGRKDTWLIREALYASEKMEEMLDEVLFDTSSWYDVAAFRRRVKKLVVNATYIIYRLNDNDGCPRDKKTDKRNRPFRRQSSPSSYQAGVWNTRRVEVEQRRILKAAGSKYEGNIPFEHELASWGNRARAVYSARFFFQVSLSIHMKMLMARMESFDGRLISLTGHYLSRMERFEVLARGYGCEICEHATFDRTNSEQFEGDNFEQTMAMYPAPYRRIVEACRLVILPGFEGARVSSKALPSGTADVSKSNFESGLHMSAEVLTRAELRLRGRKPTLQEAGVAKTWARWLAVMRHCTAFQDWNVLVQHKKGVCLLMLNIGRDDQVHHVAYQAEDDPFVSALRRTLDEDGEVCRFKGRLDAKCTAYGMKFDGFSLGTSASSVLGKWTLDEHTQIGDIAASRKYLSAHSNHNAKGLLDELLKKHFGAGIEGYAAGWLNVYEKIIPEYGFAVDQIFDPYSPAALIAVDRFGDMIDYEYEAAAFDRDITHRRFCKFLDFYERNDASGVCARTPWGSHSKDAWFAQSLQMLERVGCRVDRAKNLVVIGIGVSE